MRITPRSLILASASSLAAPEAAEALAALLPEAGWSLPCEPPPQAARPKPSTTVANKVLKDWCNCMMFPFLLEVE